MDDTLAFRIGASNREHLVVQPTRRSNPAATDFWEGNWIYATIVIAARAFRGRFEALLRAEDFVSFRDQLRPLHATLTGHATFETLEQWLRVYVVADGKGHFHAECNAVDQPGVGNRLTFTIDFDQTELPAILRGLDAICEALPVVGDPRRPR